MQYDGIRQLSDTVQFLILQMPDADQRDAIVRLSGTWVATVKIQRSADLKTWADLTVTNVVSGAQANPTGNGVFGAQATAADRAVRVILSAYTSGIVRVEGLLVKA